MTLSYPDAVKWFFSFARFDMHLPRESDYLKLVRMEQILSELGSPHHQSPSVLIAGTKGKGSTAALIENVLRAAGYRTGLFTSPHLHTFRERVRINGEMISAAQVVETTARLQELEPNFPYSTYFEWVTALAFESFAKAHVDIAVVEVGLGGRLDCTNVLTPRLCVITPISYDHMDILGDTLAKIASEKAGIIKPHVPVVVAPQESEAMDVISQTACENDAPLLNVAETWHWKVSDVTPHGQTVLVGPHDSPHPAQFNLPLLGPHQRLNLATALASITQLRQQGWQVSDDAVRRGVETVQWNARFEILSLSPDESSSPKAILTDGAHNRASAHELVRTLDEVFPGRKVLFIFGASTDKDLTGMLQELAPRASCFIFSQAHNSRAASPTFLTELAASFGVESHTAPDVAHALTLASGIASPNDVICITGSLFIAAESRELVLHLPPAQ